MNTLPAVHTDAAVRAFLGGGYVSAVVPLIDQATQTLDVVQYQWRHYPRNRGRRVMQFFYATCAAARRGVRVRVLLNREAPGHHLTRANERTARLLREVGAEVKFGRAAVADHAKLWLIDGKILVVCSHNLSSRSVEANTEVGVVVWSEGVARDVLAYFERVWARE